MIYTPLHLNAGCPPGQNQPFNSLGPDGTTAPFALPAGSKFALTDVSVVIANIGSATPPLVQVGIRQVLGSGHVQRWNFAGYTIQNVERSFKVPIMFSTNFELWNVSNTADLNVNLFGYLTI
jgi:hypothetical protein